MLCRIVAWGGWAEVGQWLKDWQTLVAGGIALVAAYIAVRPVHLQLALMRAQNAVMVRGPLVEMISRLDVEWNGFREILSDPMKNIGLLFDDLETGAEWYYGEWESKHCVDFDDALRELFKLFANTYDTDAIEAKKAKLLEAVGGMKDALWAFRSPHLSMIHSQEFNWTQEEEAQAIKGASAAQQKLPYLFDQLSDCSKELSSAYESRRLYLGKSLRMIDDSLLAKS